jgi:hypothetical protein
MPYNDTPPHPGPLRLVWSEIKKFPLPAGDKSVKTLGPFLSAFQYLTNVSEGQKLYQSVEYIYSFPAI